MRKSRFLLSLIAATALGLSVVGCESGDSGAIADTTDLTRGVDETRSQLREYMLVGARGLLTPAATLITANATANPPVVGQTQPVFPTGTPAPTIFVGPQDAGIVASPPQLWELFGISDSPSPNANITAPGDASSKVPATPDTQILFPADTAFHEIYPSPGGVYAIGLSRGRGHGIDPADTVTNSNIQIFQLNIAQPLDVQFPPAFNFGVTQDPVTEYFFKGVDQGEFVSGAWSSNAQQFYVGMNNSILTLRFDGTIGRVDFIQTVNFPTAPAGVNINNLRGINNPVKIIVSPDGQVVYALDNANGQLVTYRRNQADGTLTQVGTTTVPADPRGMTLDRSGRYLYVAGRGSEQLAGYRVAADGTVAAIDIFPALGLGAIPFNIGDPLGDVAANPQTDALFLSTYLGVMQAYSIDPATGGLQASGTGARPLGNARNAGNIEVEPTGRFVIAAYEADLDSFQPYVSAANGFPFSQTGPQSEAAVFTNVIPMTNDATQGGQTLSPGPQLDALGRIIFTSPYPTNGLFTGEIQGWRIENTGQVRSEIFQAASNPYGLQFFQKVFQVPGGDGTTPIQP